MAEPPAVTQRTTNELGDRQLDLNLVIIHYHLNRGGVTSVIRNQIKALAGCDSVAGILVLHGEGTEGWPDYLKETEAIGPPGWITFETLPGLGYQTSGELDPTLPELVKEACHRRGFVPAETLIQIHNHGLGKNNSLLVAIPRLAAADYRVLLQVHDFAEDMRPENFLAIQQFCRQHGFDAAELGFPNHPAIHFAFLNHRDLKLISGNHAIPSRCHLLPNPVVVPPLGEPPTPDGIQRVRQTLGCQEAERLVIYPVRAIRRKNVAEAMLFAVANPDVRLAVTLPAVTEDERRPYERVKLFSQRWGLPVFFEAGQQGLDFSDLIRSADFILTSSVAEGFGMVFLETWCWGQTLIGRDLPDITRDFVDVGMDLDHLYDAVRIPAEWIDWEEEVRGQQALLDRVLRQFEIESTDLLDFERERRAGWIDFAKLRLDTQLELLRKVNSESAAKQQLLEINPRFQIPPSDSRRIEHNAAVVRQHFSAEAFRQRFLDIGKQIFDSSRVPATSVSLSNQHSPRDLVRRFLDPDRFIPLRVETECK